jgi:hypothetical protein
MGLLDDLKQQAETEQARQRTQQEDRSRSLVALHQALGDASRCLADFARTLEVVKPVVARSYPVDSIARLENLLQSGDAVRERRKTVEFRDYLEQVALRLHAVGGQSLTVRRRRPARHPRRPPVPLEEIGPPCS